MNNLPDLPRVLKRKEASSGLVFRDWLEANINLFDRSSSFELKDSHGKDYISFSAIEREQEISALKNETGNVIRITVGTKGTADYILMIHAHAYIVIKYKKFFSIIHINDFLKEKQTSIHRSLTSTKAQEIATKVIHR